MKTAGLILLLTALSVAAQTNQTPACCRHPLRVFGDHATVNLTPLFQWWLRHGGAQHSQRPKKNALAGDAIYPDRPLTAWQHVIGVTAADQEYTWLVDAEIATSPMNWTNARIVLKNPPVAEEQLYYSLKTLLPQYDQQITNDAHAYQAALKAQKNADARATAEARSRNWRTRANAGNYSQLAAQERTAADAALADQKKIEQARDLAQKQLNAISSANGRYQIDIFALEIGQNRQGQLIFDPGVVDANSP